MTQATVSVRDSSPHIPDPSLSVTTQYVGDTRSDEALPPPLQLMLPWPTEIHPAWSEDDIIYDHRRGQAAIPID